MREQDSLVSVCTSGYDTLKTSDTSEKEPHSLNSLNEVAESSKVMEQQCNETKDSDSLTSFGESSGYDSFKYRVDDNEDDGFAEDSFRKSFIVKNSDTTMYDEIPSVRNWRVSAESIIGKEKVIRFKTILIIFFSVTFVVVTL